MKSDLLIWIPYKFLIKATVKRLKCIGVTYLKYWIKKVSGSPRAMVTDSTYRGKRIIKSLVSPIFGNE